MKISVEVSDARIEDLLFGHQGQCSPWIKNQGLEGSLINGSTIHIVYDKESDDEGDFTGALTVTREMIEKGLSVMAQNEPYQWDQFIRENDDDWTFDTAWQCIVFGKTIYG